MVIFLFKVESNCDFNPNIELINITNKHLLNSNNIENLYFTQLDDITKQLQNHYY